MKERTDEDIFLVELRLIEMKNENESFVMEYGDIVVDDIYPIYFVLDIYILYG